MREEIQDRRGNPIYLTDERWAHIIDGHPELSKHRSEILKNVRSGKRMQHPFFPDTFLYKKRFPQLTGGLKHIEVVVIFHWQGANQIISLLLHTQNN